MPQQIKKVNCDTNAIRFLQKTIAEVKYLMEPLACSNKVKFMEQILEYQRVYDLWPDTFIYDELLHREFMHVGMDNIITQVANLIGEYNYVILAVPRMGKSQSEVFKRLGTTQLVPPPDPFERRRPGDS